MYQKKMQEDIRCPLEYGLAVFGGKWKSRIICVLAEKKLLRYSELRREMANITDAVLATTLKELIADEMNPENSWVGDLEWKDGIPADDKIELDFLDRRSDTDETECYWLITDTWNFGTHTYISIEIKEVL